MYIRTYHIHWYFEPGKVLSVLVLLVDDLSQLPPVHNLLKHPHPNLRLEFCMLLDIGPNNAGNGRAPTREDTLHTRSDGVCSM